MYTILIADDDAVFINLLAEELHSHPQYDLVSEASDGSSAINKIEEYRPDIVLLDVILPGADGIYIANHIRHQMPDYNPHLYMLSNIGTSELISSFNSLNIDFYSMKPVSSAVIIGNLDRIAGRNSYRQRPGSYYSQTVDESNRTDITAQIEPLLINLGLPYLHKSAKYIKAAIRYCLEHPDGTQLITKRLYPDIARQYQIAPSAVERSIRYGIHRMHYSNRSTYQCLVKDKIGNDRMTNTEFLIAVSEYLTQGTL